MTQTIDLSPQILNLKLYAGDGVTFRLSVKNKDDEPVNLIGTMEAQIRLKRGLGDDPLAEFSIDLSEAEDGIARLTLTGEQTQELIPITNKRFHGVWDLQWTPTDGQPRTLCQGRVECFTDVSR